MLVVIWCLVLVMAATGRQIQQNVIQNYKQRILQQADEIDCDKESGGVFEKYPTLVAIRNPADRRNPNGYLMCTGVLISTDRLLTSAACVWSQVEQSTPHNLVDLNLVNNTFDFDFQAAISPYCSAGDGAEVVQILGYHIQEEYDGYAEHGNALAILELETNTTSVQASQIMELKQTKVPIGANLTMVGLGSRTNAQSTLLERNFSVPFKLVRYTTISNEECQSLIRQLWESKIIDDETESCAVVSEVQDVGVCNGDDGSPLFDAEGKLAGVVTWWTVNRCETTKDQTMPIVYADISKMKAKNLIQESKREDMYIYPNISGGCGDGQNLDEAPFIVSLQFVVNPNQDNPYIVHSCGGVLIDGGKRVLTAAQCLYNDVFPLEDGTRTSIDLRNPESPSKIEGEMLFPLLIGLAPRCRNMNGIFNRTKATYYYIHPSYNGNPRKGYDIAILDLANSFPSERSFGSFAEQIQVPLEKSQVSDAEFFGWGAEYPSEARNDYKGFWNNYKPAKQVSMDLIPNQQCVQSLYSINTKNSFVEESDLCAVQQGKITNICIFDAGSPLVGRVDQDLVLIGLLTWDQDRLCLDGPAYPEIFTDVRALSSFILGVINQQPLSTVVSVFPSPFSGAASAASALATLAPSELLAQANSSASIFNGNYTELATNLPRFATNQLERFL